MASVSLVGKKPGPMALHVTPEADQAGRRLRARGLEREPQPGAAGSEAAPALDGHGVDLRTPGDDAVEQVPPHAGLVIQGVALVACYLVDRRVYPAFGLSKWMTLRFRLTFVAALCCFVAAACT